MEDLVLSSGIKEKYVRPESERPNLSQIPDCRDVSFIITQIRNACQAFGFFQVVNHGVSKAAVEQMVGVAKEFFRLPVVEKMKLHNWRDYLRLQSLDQYVPDWPSVPNCSAFMKKKGEAMLAEFQIMRENLEQLERITLVMQEMIVDMGEAMVEQGEMLSGIHDAQVSTVDALVRSGNTAFQQRAMSLQKWKSFVTDRGYAEAIAKVITGCQALVGGGDGPEPAVGSAPNP